MSFLSFIVLLAIGYLLWRVTDQLPDLIFRLSEIQRDIADIRRRMTESDSGSSAPSTAMGSAPQASQPTTSGGAASPAAASSAPVTGDPASGGSSNL